MPEIIYRKATLNDLQLLVDSRMAFLVGFSGPQDNMSEKMLRDELEKYLHEGLERGQYVSFLAFAGDTFVAVGGMVLRTQPGNFKNPSGKVAYIMNMYTVPAFRRRGISTKLLDLLQEEGKRLGYTAFELHATQAGEPVYIQNGFKLHGEPTYRKYPAG